MLLFNIGVTSFCSACGASLQESFKYCPQCSFKVHMFYDDDLPNLLGNSSTGDTKPTAKTGIFSSPNMPSFEKFLAKKSKERIASSSFRSKTKRRSEDSDVTINIGIMKKYPSGGHEIVRGKLMPLKVKKHATQENI